MIRRVGGAFQGFSEKLGEEGRLEGVFEGDSLFSSCVSFSFEAGSNGEEQRSISDLNSLKGKIGTSELILPRIRGSSNLDTVYTVYEVKGVDGIALPKPLCRYRGEEDLDLHAPLKPDDRWSDLMLYIILENKKCLPERFFEMQNMTHSKLGNVNLFWDV